MKNYILNDIVSFQNGYAFDSKDMGQHGTNIIKIKEIKNNRIIITDSTQKIAKCDKSIIHKYQVNYDDILIALTGDPINKGSVESWVGRAAIYKELNFALLNQRMCKIIPDTKYILNKYLYYFLISFPTLYKLASAAKGSANQANISHKDVGNLEINIPSLEVQQHIVDIIGSIDDKIENNNKLIEKILEKLNLYHSKFKQENKCIKENIFNISEIKYGKSIATSDILETGLYPVYGSNGIIGFLDNYIYSEHKIAISCRGNSSGIIHLTEENATITSNSLVLDFNNFKYTYYFYLEFMKKGLFEFKTGSAQPQITIDNLKKLDILIPNNIDEYFEKVSCNIEYIYKLKKENSKLNELKQLYLKKFFG